LSQGQAFVALKTDRRDGHDYLPAAFQAGASAALVSHPDPIVPLPQLVVENPLAALQAIAAGHRQAFLGTVIGITGSAGKTSTKELLAVLLGGRDADVLATEGNLNNQIGVALTLSRLEPSHRYAVIEAGISGPGEMEPLAAMIDPDMVVVTLVGPAHLADLGGLEGVAREKAVLAAAVRRGGACFFPKSCEAFSAFRALPPDCCNVLVPSEKFGGVEPSPGLIRFAVAHTEESTTVTVASGVRSPLSVTLRRVTDGMAQNTAMAVSVALRIGIQPDEIRSRLLSWRPSPLRGEWKLSEGRRLYLDCYNANPVSMADALAAFRAIAPREEPRVFVIGCMEELGSGTVRYHVELGRSLSLRPGDLLMVMGSQADAIRQGALEAGSSLGQVEIADSIEAVSMRLAGFRGSVFVKGSRRHGLERAFVGVEIAEASHA
jgi:UDP-N-acetylmuramoyl-tripeptide--D-alanyl-D-alanine ligase